MFASVIITTKNEEKNIANCLESVKNQDFSAGEMEIIVVDNNSSDKTKEIASRYTEKVFNRGNERSAQRNFGVKMANGKYILYLDADMTICQNLISGCVSRLEENQDIVALFVPEIILGKGFWGKVRKFERSFYNETVIDGLRFFRKEKFVEAGGFDENLKSCEDWDLDKRIKKMGKTDITKNFIFHNEKNFSLKKYLEKKAYYGQDFEKYIAKWGKDDGDVKKQFGFFYRYFGVFLENGKWKKIFIHPILMLGVLALRVFVGCIYLIKK